MKNILDFRQIHASFTVWVMDSRGVTSIEIGLIVSGISTVLASAGMVFGDELSHLLDNLSGSMNPNVMDMEYSGD